MEPYDFDKLIRDRVLDEGNLHSREASNARQGIWMDIQDRVKKNPAFISWYHLAASILLLIVGFSIILFKVQKHYKSENETLLVKIEKLEKNFTEGASLLDTKDQQIKMLTSNMSNLENTLAELSDQQNDVPVTKVIYKTDTVFLKTVEYVTYVPETSDGNQEQAERKIEDQMQQNSNLEVASIKTDNIIYPSPQSKGRVEDSEKVRIRFGNYIAKKE